jgi:hypothetical protein
MIASAEVVTLQASADNTLFQSEFADLSNGQGISMFSGLTLAAGLRRAVVRFDTSSIPSDATIVSATLTLNCTRAASAGDNISIHRALNSWGEGASIALGEGGNGATAETGDATWVHRFFNTQNWITPGGDFQSTSSATTFVGALGAYQWSGPSIAGDVQSWVQNASGNFGWFILSDETTSQSAKRFATREHTDPLLRPSLTITYVPGPGGLTLSLGCAVLASRRRRERKIHR